MFLPFGAPDSARLFRTRHALARNEQLPAIDLLGGPGIVLLSLEKQCLVVSPRAPINVSVPRVFGTDLELSSLMIKAP